MLNTHLGKLYDLGFIRCEDPQVEAALYYSKACLLAPSEQFTSDIEASFIGAGKCKEAADFLTEQLPHSTNRDYDQLQIDRHRATAKAFSHWSGKDAIKKVNELVAELGLDTPEPDEVAQPEKKHTAKINKRNKGRTPSKETSASPAKLQPDQGLSLPETSGILTAGNEDTSPVDVPEPADSDPLVLPGHWDRNVFKYLRVALSFRRAEYDDFQSEKIVLDRGIKTLQNTAGVERLYEERAWNRIRLQRSPAHVLEDPERDSATELKSISLALLSEAESDLFTALSIKLGISKQQTSILYEGNNW